MTTAQPKHVVRLATLPRNAPSDVAFMPSPETVELLKAELGLLGLRKMRFTGTLEPVGKKDWRLHAVLGVTVVQPCSVTLDPVTTRLDETVERHYLADWAPPQEAEVEMPEDDAAEPLPDAVDLADVAKEALVLALPDFPRSPQAEAGGHTAAPPGAVADDDTETENPFAVLQALKRPDEN